MTGRLRCVLCGRRLLSAAASLPAVDTGPTPHPAGPVGPTCARNAGLVPRSLFSCKRVVSTRRASRRAAASPQADWLAL